MTQYRSGRWWVGNDLLWMLWIQRLEQRHEQRAQMVVSFVEHLRKLEAT